ncbi:MAG TPA: KEOPS complex subunit Cgi121 [Nitrosopumilaceae archaeon]|nr:KEOPS complex subunit Cgi121 [Nitrosopumilaceae archaeon]
MITVKLLGGAKKSLSADKIEFEKDDSTVSELLDLLQNKIEKNMPPLDMENMLVAVNGVDSSALDGFATKLKNGDIVTIIPVIHGGSTKRIRFEISNKTIDLLEIKAIDDPIEFLDGLRKKYHDLAIQGIGSYYVLNAEHARKIILISLEAQKSGVMLSNKIETDLLMRFACTKQIGKAIQKVGLKKKQDFILISIGKKSSLDKLYDELKTSLKPKQLSRNNSTFLKKEFEITKKHFDAIASKTPLEDLLAEKAAVLFR